MHILKIWNRNAEKIIECNVTFPARTMMHICFYAFLSRLFQKSNFCLFNHRMSAIEKGGIFIGKLVITKLRKSL